MYLAEEIAEKPRRAGAAQTSWLGLFDFLQAGMEAAREARDGGDVDTALRQVFQNLRRRMPVRLQPATGDDDPHRPDAVMADLLMEGRLSLLGQPPRELGSPVDWFAGFAEDPQWTAHLGYFYWSRALARRWALTGDEGFAERWFELVGDFIAAMPWGTPALSYHPAHPAALDDAKTCDNGESDAQSPAHWISLSAEMRASAWLDGLALLSRSRAFQPERVFPILESLAGDHFFCMVNNPRANTPNQYFGTSTVLLKLGLVLPEMRFSSAAFEIGSNRLRHVIASQMFPDGTDLEQSPNYNKAAMVHLFEILELLDHAGASASRKEIFRRAAIARTRYLSEICSPDLRLPDLAKAHAEDMAPMLLKWAEMLGAPDVEWRASHGARGTPIPRLSAWMPFGGYAVVRDSWNREASQLFFKAGRLGLGHMHEDALSFTLHLRGKPVLVDSGHFTYTSGNPEETALNTYAVTSAAHNTALVDGAGQNRTGLVAARFPSRRTCDIPPLDASKLPRLPWRAHEGGGFAFLEGSYADGYGHDHGIRATHRRQILWCEGRGIFVLDRFFSVSRECTLCWQIAPGLTATPVGTDGIRLADGNHAVATLSYFPSAAPRINFSCGSLEPVAGWYFPAYGKKVPKTDIRVAWSASGEASCATWMDFSGNPGCARRSGTCELSVAHADGWRLAISWNDPGDAFSDVSWQVEGSPQTGPESLPPMCDLSTGGFDE